MKRSEVIKIIDETYSVTPEYLWDGETHAVFRHPVSNKWFGIIMEVKKENLHIEGCECSDETEDVMNVKANPVLIEDLLHEQAFCCILFCFEYIFRLRFMTFLFAYV